MLRAMRAISQRCDLTSASTQAGFASTSEAMVTAVVDGELPQDSIDQLVSIR
jgi:hypothetical protein